MTGPQDPTTRPPDEPGEPGAGPSDVAESPAQEPTPRPSGRTLAAPASSILDFDFGIDAPKQSFGARPVPSAAPSTPLPSYASSQALSASPEAEEWTLEAPPLPNFTPLPPPPPPPGYGGAGAPPTPPAGFGAAGPPPPPDGFGAPGAPAPAEAATAAAVADATEADATETDATETDASETDASDTDASVDANGSTAPGDTEVADGAAETAGSDGADGTAPDGETSERPEPGDAVAPVAEAPLPEVAEERVGLVKAARDRTPAQVAETVVRRYAMVAVVIAVVILVANLLPSARATEVTASTAPASTNGSVALLPGMTPPTPAYGAGTTVGGVACGPGVRQVPWSAYAPPCQPAWHGNNGGATTHGVTGKTITLTYRSASTAQLAELYGLIPPTVVGTNAEAEQTLQSYVNTFNKSFELYGRKVVLVPFNGKGDFIDEDLGEDQSQAQEDAVTVATSINAFADMSVVDASALYATDLAAQHVVTTSLYENPASWYQTYAPYEYSPGPNCSKMAQATGAILGKQLGGLPASLAGDPAIRSEKRVFGMISPLNPNAAACASADEAAMSATGHPIVKSVTVKFDLSALIATASASVAEMKAAGVTTVILSSADPITPKFFFQAADADHYYPEWWFQSYFANGQTDNDAYTRLWPSDQTKDIFGLGVQTQPRNLQEAITAYRLGNYTPGAQPVPSFFWDYASILPFFEALQLAGPDLTPVNYEAAMHRIIQSSSGGMLMGWNGASGPYDPSSSFGVVKYTLALRSPLDGQFGTYISCDGGKQFAYSDTASDVPAHQQIVCAKTVPVKGT